VVLASCVASALWPERVTGLISLAGYDIIDVAQLLECEPPSQEHAVWYQHMFQTERVRKCLTKYRRELCRMLWSQWSPTWNFDDAVFERTAPSFDNPYFVDVVVHAYRFHFGLAAGDPALIPLEEKLARRPTITVPSITLDGARDTLKPEGTAHHARMFTGQHQHRTVEVGHNLPQEAPAEFADAILAVRHWTDTNWSATERDDIALLSIERGQLHSRKSRTDGQTLAATLRPVAAVCGRGNLSPLETLRQRETAALRQTVGR